jgi:hypothetical protein
MTSNPYSDLPPDRFWRTGVAEAHPLTVADLYKKKFVIRKQDKIATAGSCFAQHLAIHLQRRGYSILDVEPPIPGMSREESQRYGYMIYSARYGNIYTTRQLLQLVEDAFQPRVREESVWENNGRFFDGLRPAVEPEGLSSAEEVRVHRLHHLEKVRQLFTEADVLVFTLGLTEAWVHRETGTAYPICPGVVAGSFDPELYEFKNFQYPEIYQDLVDVRNLLKKHNPGLRFLLTVSPVPLTATASNHHVLVATTWSKSTLRSVCGALEREFADVDYFPSYELIATPFSRAFFYGPNLRSVTMPGVEAVMRVFFLEHGLPELLPTQEAATQGTVGLRPKTDDVEDDDDEAVCEEKLLESFA